MKRNRSFPVWLERLSLLYLAVPWVIFGLGWLRFPYSLLMIGLIVTGLFLSFRKSDNEEEAHADSLSWVAVGAIGFVAVGWVGLSGAGGYGLQNWDWLKHNAILKDLIGRPWPIAYRTGDGEFVTLNYYLAYYLPSAVIGRVAGWKAAQLAIFGTSFLGVFLSLLWFAKSIQKSPVMSVLLFVVLGGMDVIGNFCVPYIIGGTEHIERWAMYCQYRSNSTFLFWAPQQCIGGWVATFVVLHQVVIKKSTGAFGFVFALLSLWSPLVAVGLIPVLVASLLKHRRIREGYIVNLIIAPLLLAMVGSYYGSHSSDVIRGWYYHYYKLKYFWPSLFFFYLVEFGLYAFFVRNKSILRDDSGAVWWWTAVGTLLVLPFYRIGAYWDLTMQASLPALVIVWIVIGRNLMLGPRDGFWKVLLVLIFIGSLTAGTEIVRSLAHRPKKLVAKDEIPSVIGLSSDWFINQNLGRSDSFFMRFIAKPIRYARE